MKNILFRISSEEITFARRSFGACEAEVRDKLETIGHVFVGGYRLAMEVADAERLIEKLEQTYDAHHVGFAYEGAGFYFALLDMLWPRKQSRLRAFTDGAARKHDYIVTVGAGFALARMPWGARYLDRYLRKLDPMLAWCVPDGYGFHEGFFHHQKVVERQVPPPSHWPAYAQRLYDAGVGRSLWWVCGADPDRIRQAIDCFPEPRRAELWCGVGLACTYAGGVSKAIVQALSEAAGPYQADVRSAAPFAASMRVRGSNPSPWTDHVCDNFLGMTATQAAAWIEVEQDAVRAALPPTGAARGGQQYLAIRRCFTDSLAQERIHFAET